MRATDLKRKEKMKRLVLATVFAAFGSAFAVESQIVLPESPTPSEAYAADELASYICQITGCRPAVQRKGAAGSASIVLRQCADPDLGEDGFRVKTDSAGSVVITGGCRGVLYGVYDILEKFGGVKWLASWHTLVPKSASFKVPCDLDYVEKPAYLLRMPYYADVLGNPDFAARLRVVGGVKGVLQKRLQPKHGGEGPKFSTKYAWHTFHTLVSPDEYFETNPEYFSEVNGRRIKDHTQLCLSNPDVYRIALEKIRRELREHPEVSFVNVSHMDYDEAWCTCPACRAVDAEEGGPVGSELRFINRLADGIAEEFPAAMIHMDAYQYTRHPPLKEKARPNVIVQYSTIEGDLSFPFRIGKHPRNEEIRKYLTKWAAVTQKLMVWDFTTSFNDYPVALPMVYSIPDNIRYYRDLGVRYLISQGSYQGWHGENAELKTYLMAKLMWNPDLDEGKVIDEFFSGYYGKASPYIREYFEDMHRRQRAFSADGQHFLGCYSAFSAGDDAFYSHAAELWNQAHEAVREEPPVYGYNVRMGAMAFDYTFLKLRAKKFWASRDPQRVQSAGDTPHAVANRIKTAIAEARAAGRPVRFAEPNHIEQEFLANLDSLAAKESVREQTGRVIVKAEEMERHWRLKPQKDVPGALDGVAFKLSKSHHDWCPVVLMSSVAFDSGVKYRIRIHARIDMKPQADPKSAVFWAGVVNRVTDMNPLQRIWTARETTDGWQWLDLGEAVLEDGQFLWIGTGSFDKNRYLENPACETILVDQVEISR